MKVDRTMAYACNVVAATKIVFASRGCSENPVQGKFSKREIKKVVKCYDN